MKSKKKKCSRCGARFYSDCRIGEYYYTGKNGKKLGIYYNHKVYCRKCMPIVRNEIPSTVHDFPSFGKTEKKKNKLYIVKNKTDFLDKS